MKSISLILLCFLSISSFAQTDVKPDTSGPSLVAPPMPAGSSDPAQASGAITTAMDSQGFVTVMIPQTQQRQVQKDWIAYAGRGSKGKAEVVNADDIQRGAINRNISPDAFDISCRQLGTTDGVRLTVWLTDNNTSRQQTSDRDIALQKYVRDFAVMEYRYAVNAELKAQQSKEAEMENGMTKLVREEEKAEKKTEGNNASIKKTREAIIVNDHDIQSMTAKIESQKTNVENNAADPNAAKGAKKTLGEMEGQKRALQRQNEKQNKDILIWTDEIRANDRYISDTREKETSQRALIEKQKQIVRDVQAKLAGTQ